MPRRLKRLLSAMLIGLVPFMANAASQTFTLSVVPQFSPVDIGLRWTPLLQRLESETGYGFQLRLINRIPQFETDFQSGVPDLVFLNPYHMVMASKTQGYIPLVRSSQPLKGILVVARNGRIKKLQDIKGKTVAFPSPNAFGASLYMRALLSGKEGLSFTSNYVGTHQNVYRHVMLGESEAGGGIEATLEREPPALRSRLQVLYTTPGFAPHPLAAHPRVPQAVREKIIAALRKIDQEPNGNKLLAETELDQVISADYARDYQPLEKLRLEHHVNNK